MLFRVSCLVGLSRAALSGGQISRKHCELLFDTDDALCADGACPARWLVLALFIILCGRCWCKIGLLRVVPFLLLLFIVSFWDRHEVRESSEFCRQCLLWWGRLCDEVTEGTATAWFSIGHASFETRFLGLSVALIGPLLDDTVSLPLSTECCIYNSCTTLVYMYIF